MAVHIAYTITCNSCSTTAWDYSTGDASFGSIEVAKRILTTDESGAWRWDSSGQTCPRCLRRERQAACEHEWVERESFISWVECSKCGLQRDGGHV